MRSLSPRTAGRTSHRRHGTPRFAPHRQSASRPIRSAGRSRFKPVLPVARRRTDAEVHGRRRPQSASAARDEGRRKDRQPDGFAADRRRSEEGRRTALRIAEVPARDGRDHGRAAEARLHVPAGGARRASVPRDRPRDVRPADRKAGGGIHRPLLRSEGVRRVRRRPARRQVRRPRIHPLRLSSRRRGWRKRKPFAKPKGPSPRSSTRTSRKTATSRNGVGRRWRAR